MLIDSSATVTKLERVNGVVKYYQDDVLRFTAPAAYHGPLRLWIGSTTANTVINDVQWVLPNADSDSLAARTSFTDRLMLSSRTLNEVSNNQQSGSIATQK